MSLMVSLVLKLKKVGRQTGSIMSNTDKKKKSNQSSRLERKQNKKTFKEKFESFYDNDKKRSVRDADYAKKAMLNPFRDDVDASKFPGFDQANRIRGGLKKGGSVKKKKSSGAAIRGKGCEIR